MISIVVKVKFGKISKSLKILQKLLSQNFVLLFMSLLKTSTAKNHPIQARSESLLIPNFVLTEKMGKAATK